MNKYEVKHENGLDTVEAKSIKVQGDGRLEFWTGPTPDDFVAVYAPKCWWSVRKLDPEPTS